MRFCHFCGTGLNDNMAFCHKCGKAFEDATDINKTSKKTSALQEIDYVCEKEVPTKNYYKKTASFLAIICIVCILITTIFVYISKKETVIGNTPTLNSVKDSVNSVLYLESFNSLGELIGTASGFVIEDGNTLVTNYHVIEDSYSLVAWSSDRKRSYEVKTLLAHDYKKDLAVLECNTNNEISPLFIGDSSIVAQGNRVYAIGYPLGIANTLSEGIVSSKYTEDEVDYLQITAAISSGSSGGAVLNENEEVIGIVCAYYSNGQNLNLAIASNELKELISKEYVEQSLVNHYNSLNRYGSTPTNLLGGNIIAEDDRYTFFVDSMGRIKRFDNTNLSDISIAGSLVNLYKNSLYYYDSEINDICKSGLHFEDIVALGILSDEKVPNKNYKRGYAYRDFVRQMLIAKDRIILNYSLYDDKSGRYGSESLIAMDINAPSTVLYCSPPLSGDFTYYGNYIYAALSEGGILKLNIDDFTETIIETECTAWFQAITEEGTILFLDSAMSNNSIYLFNAKYDTVCEFDLQEANFAVISSEKPFANSFFPHENGFYFNVWDYNEKVHSLFYFNSNGEHSFIGESLVWMNHGISKRFDACVFLNNGEQKFNLLKNKFSTRTFSSFVDYLRFKNLDDSE